MIGTSNTTYLETQNTGNCKSLKYQSELKASVVASGDTDNELILRAKAFTPKVESDVELNVTFEEDVSNSSIHFFNNLTFTIENPGSKSYLHTSGGTNLNSKPKLNEIQIVTRFAYTSYPSATNWKISYEEFEQQPALSFGAPFIDFSLQESFEINDMEFMIEIVK